MTDYNSNTVRQLEGDSIRAFVQSCDHLFPGGEVLDFGCGKEPYRDIVESAGGIYTGYDRISYPGNVSASDVGPDEPFAGRFAEWDVILCNQVIQYTRHPVEFLAAIRWGLIADGPLVLTGPTNWAEVEKEDLQRFTLSGICDALAQAHWRIERAEVRAEINLNGFRLPLGYGVVARA